MLRPGDSQHRRSFSETVAFKHRESETLKVPLDLLAQSRASADKVANATAQAFMNRIESDGPEIERRFFPQPRISFNHRLGSLTDPIAALVEPVLDAPVKEFPQRRHAHHPGNVAILDCPSQGVAG